MKHDDMTRLLDAILCLKTKEELEAVCCYSGCLDGGSYWNNPAAQ